MLKIKEKLTHDENEKPTHIADRKQLHIRKHSEFNIISYLWPTKIYFPKFLGLCFFRSCSAVRTVFLLSFICVFRLRAVSRSKNKWLCSDEWHLIYSLYINIFKEFYINPFYIKYLMYILFDYFFIF